MASRLTKLIHPDFPGASGVADWRGNEYWSYGKGRMALRLLGKPGDPEFADSYAQATGQGEYAPKPDEMLLQRARAGVGAGIDPFSYAPRGMNRVEAARYVGVGTTLFDQMIADRRMPKPTQVDGRVIWDRVQLDIAFTALPKQGESRRNYFDRALP